MSEHFTEAQLEILDQVTEAVRRGELALVTFELDGKMFPCLTWVVDEADGGSVIYPLASLVTDDQLDRMTLMGELAQTINAEGSTNEQKSDASNAASDTTAAVE